MTKLFEIGKFFIDFVFGNTSSANSGLLQADALSIGYLESSYFHEKSLKITVNGTFRSLVMFSYAVVYMSNFKHGCSIKNQESRIIRIKKLSHDGVCLSIILLMLSIKYLGSCVGFL